MNLGERTVALTGSTGGIGRAVAHLLAGQGVSIIALGRNKSELVELVDSLPVTDKARHRFVQVDLNSPQSLTNLNKQLLQSDGLFLDTLINMAGMGSFSLLEKQSPERIAEIINVNVTAPILLTRQMLPILKKSPTPLIVNVGSIMGSLGYPGHSVYSASKFALRGFSQALERELSDTSVKIKYFAPRATQTRFNSAKVEALNRQLGYHADTPEEVAQALVAFMRNSRLECIVGWPEKFFVFLNQFMPALISFGIKKRLAQIKSYL